MFMHKPPQERYLFKPYFGSSHYWALSFVEKLNPEINVLDVGSGSGALGEALKQSGFLRLSAVEIDPSARQHGASIYQRIEENIESFANETFELIFLLDVLEHISFPEEFLGKVIKLLAPNGLLLISVPNVAHWYIRLSLLFGYFEYTERGILDRTHLHFFTYTSLHRLLKSSLELEILESNASIIPYPLFLPKVVTSNFVFRLLSKAEHLLARILPGIFAYQHLVVLRKTIQGKQSNEAH